MHFSSAISIQQVIVVTLITISETTVMEPSSPIRAFAGETVYLRWSSNEKILVVTWGIRSGSLADPQYLFVDKSEIPVNNSALDDELRRRLHYIGNLTAGRAWFAISNATLRDSNTYIAVIREDVSGSTALPYTVQVIVEPKPTAATTTPSTTINGLAGNCSGVNCTSTPTPTPSGSTTPSNDTTTITPTTTEPSGWSAGQIAGVVVGALAGAVVIVVIVIVVKKHYKKSQQDNPPTDKKQDTEMKTSTAAKA